MKKVLFILAPLYMVSYISCNTIPPSVPQSQPNQGNNPYDSSQNGTTPTNNGVISYNIPPQNAIPAATQPNMGTNTAQSQTTVAKKKEPLVSNTLEQELSAMGLEAKKIFAVIENNRIVLVGPKESAPKKNNSRKKRKN